MFEEDQSGIDMDGRRVSRDTPIDRLPKDMDNVIPGGKPGNKLDGPAMRKLHSRLMGYHQRELERQSENRAQQALDEDFYDNEQWTEDEKRILRDRGQAAIVYNVISSTVNFVLGTQRRARTDYKILPRKKQDAQPAQRKTELMKYLSDVNHAQFHKSDAFADAIKVGIGWRECALQDDDDGEPIAIRYEDWRNMLWDSAAVARDLSDARYIIRFKHVDLDLAIGMFPDRRRQLEAAARMGDRDGPDLDNLGDEASDAQEDEISEMGGAGIDFDFAGRRRVRLFEVWFRKLTKVEKFSGGTFSGELFDEASPGHVEAANAGDGRVIQKTQLVMHVAIMTASDLLYVGRSPYRHNRFPFTPIWGYRRGRNKMPYGMIRGMRDIQADINKRASKALHILSSNKVIMDEGAVPDIKTFAEEVARPDAIIVKRRNHELELNADRDLAPAHLDLMSRAIMMIQSASGVTDENMGRKTNATSGKAIEARQSQGGLATSILFDNLRYADQLEGEVELSMIEQFITAKKEFRITGKRPVPQYITVNDELPENDITRSKADFVIGEADWANTIRQAAANELMVVMTELAPVAPQIVMVMLDLLVENMDVPGREELVNRIRAFTGMRDPDAEEPTPEEIARAEQQAKDKDRQDRLMEADIAVKNSTAGKNEAAGQFSQAQIQQIMVAMQKTLAEIAAANVETQGKALEAATAVLAVPPAVPVADTILKESGFKSQSDKDAEEARATAVQLEEADRQAAMQEQAAAQQMQDQQQQAQQAQEQQQMAAANDPNAVLQQEPQQ